MSVARRLHGGCTDVGCTAPQCLSVHGFSLYLVGPEISPAGQRRGAVRLRVPAQGGSPVVGERNGQRSAQLTKTPRPTDKCAPHVPFRSARCFRGTLREFMEAEPALFEPGRGRGTQQGGQLARTVLAGFNTGAAAAASFLAGRFD
eukprot:COSAG01_NODE_5370_length_4303_cov_1.671265_3_plen_146_part_00